MGRHLPDWPAPQVLVVPPDGRGEESVEETAEAPLPAAPASGAFRLGGLSRRRAPAGGRGGAAHPDLPDGPFVLLVSSLEPRKNHLLALTAWRILLDRRGAAGTPRLVFAGRRAPGDAPVMEALAADPVLAERVTLLHDLDDATLARLYRGCLFTLYPSRHEGWGLPVSESLLHGKVPVVSEIPALLESGRNGAVFFEPNNAEDLAAVVLGFIANPARLAAAAARIPRHGGLRPWAEVADDLLAAARRLAFQEREPPPLLPLCEPLSLGHGGSSGPHPALARAAFIQAGEGWHPPEAWGVWTRPGIAELRLPVHWDGPARVALALRPPPGARGILRVSLGRRGAAAVERESRAEEAGEISLEIEAGEPVLHLTLEADPGTPLPPDEQGVALEVGVGVVSVAVLRGGSPADRLAYLEKRILVPAQPA
nr:glycosyltransferase [Pararoseomonas baculiformis]